MSSLTLTENQLLEALEFAVHSNDVDSALKINSSLETCALSKALDKKRKKLASQIYNQRSGFVYRHKLLYQALLLTASLLAFVTTIILI